MLRVSHTVYEFGEYQAKFMRYGPTDIATKIGANRDGWKYQLAKFGQTVLLPHRKKLRLTQKGMAKNLGLTQSAISLYESGKMPPNDFGTLDTLAREYSLTEKERNEWCVYSFGMPSQLFDRFQDGQKFLSVDSLVGQLQRALAAGSPAMNSYVDQMQSPQHYNAVMEQFWPELNPLVTWLLHRENSDIKQFLLVKFSGLLTHYLGAQEYHEERIRLASAAADIAEKEGQLTTAGWLRCDAIPWTLLKHQRDLVAARNQLERALIIASRIGNTDMQALAMAFLAQADLLEGNIMSAQERIDQTHPLSCSTVIQARLFWTAGDIAFARQRFEAALHSYSRADAANPSFTSRVMAAKSCLALHDVAAAEERFEELITASQVSWQSLHKVALAKFGLAQVARLKGHPRTAWNLAREADHVLQSIRLSPNLRQEQYQVRRFLTEIIP